MFFWYNKFSFTIPLVDRIVKFPQKGRPLRRSRPFSILSKSFVSFLLDTLTCGCMVIVWMRFLWESDPPFICPGRPELAALFIFRFPIPTFKKTELLRSARPAKCSSTALFFVAVKFYGDRPATETCPGEARRAKTEAYLSEDWSVANWPSPQHSVLSPVFLNPKPGKYGRSSKFNVHFPCRRWKNELKYLFFFAIIRCNFHLTCDLLHSCCVKRDFKHRW
jgi:hypothetical protein